MLIGAYSVLLKTPGRFFGGDVAQMPAAWGTSGANRNRFVGWAGFDPYSATPVGYAPGYGWVPPIKSGGIASFNQIQGTGTVFSANLAGGLGAEATLSGSGSISDANMSLIALAVAALSGSGAVSGAIAGALYASATLAGTGDMDGALGALASVVASLSGTGAATAGVSATGNMEAEITPFTELSPENLARAVWNAVAASYNASGSMGAKLNAAGAAADPWGVDLSSYGAGTAGKELHDLSTTYEDPWGVNLSSYATSTAGRALLELFRLAGLDPTKPLVVTSSSRKVPADGTDIHQTVAESTPSGTVTVTRQS